MTLIQRLNVTPAQYDIHDICPARPGHQQITGRLQTAAGIGQRQATIRRETATAYPLQSVVIHQCPGGQTGSVTTTGQQAPGKGRSPGGQRQRQ